MFGLFCLFHGFCGSFSAVCFVLYCNRNSNVVKQPVFRIHRRSKAWSSILESAPKSTEKQTQDHQTTLSPTRDSRPLDQI